MTHKLRAFIVGLLIIGSVPISQLGQKSESNYTNDIILTADVSGQKIQISGDGRSSVLLLPTRFTLENRSNSTVLLIRKELRVGSTRLGQSDVVVEKNIGWMQNHGLPSFIDRRILKINPKSPEVIRVGKNKSYSWSSTINIHLSKTRENSFLPTDLSLEELEQSKLMWVSFDILFFPTNTLGAEVFDLSRKWKKTGNLVVGPLATKPILFNVPRFESSNQPE